MPAGVQVWDGSARLKLDTSTIAGRLLGQIDIGIGQGSLDDWRFSLGTAFAVPMMSIGSVGYYDLCAFMSQPTIWWNGTTMHWNRPSMNDSFFSNGSCTIFYGVHG